MTSSEFLWGGENKRINRDLKLEKGERKRELSMVSLSIWKKKC